MFSFLEDVPTAGRLAQNWNAVTCPLLDQRRDSARIEYKRLPLLVQSGPACTKSIGQREVERISSARRHSTNFCNGHDSRCPRFSDREGIGERSYEILPGGPLTLGK